MEHRKLTDMLQGWFVGNFSPTAFATGACEVAVKHYAAGEVHPAHYHKIATEITLVLSGKVAMAGRTWSDGDIVVLSPNEITDFAALTDATTVVVKVPGVLDDKYLVEKRQENNDK